MGSDSTVCDCGCEGDYDTHNSIQEALARDVMFVRPKRAVTDSEGSGVAGTDPRDALIETLVDALSPCQELLSGRDQMVAAISNPDDYSGVKSKLTERVDAAMEAWRAWRFN